MGGVQRTMPALVLFSDHVYSWGQEKGRWSGGEGKLRLSGRPSWGEGKVSVEREIRFEFEREGKSHVVTMYRAGEALGDGVAEAQRRETKDEKAGASRYEFRPEHDPDGIGKFYMGREIAHVMGHAGAGWLERPERLREERPDLMVESLGLRKGEIVADIGAGTGYVSWRLARAVGEGGRVYAVDIQPEMLELLNRRTVEEKTTNVVAVLGTEADPKLPASSVDLVIMVDVYHELSHPYEMLERVCGALKVGGRLVFVEYRGEDPAVAIKRLHKMTEEQVKKEAGVHGLKWEKTEGVLPRQHLMIFRRE